MVYGPARLWRTTVFPRRRTKPDRDRQVPRASRRTVLRLGWWWPRLRLCVGGGARCTVLSRTVSLVSWFVRHGGDRVARCDLVRDATEVLTMSGRDLQRHAGATVWRLGFGAGEGDLGQREAERTYGVAEDRLTRRCPGRGMRCVRRGTRRITRPRRGGQRAPHRHTPPVWTSWRPRWETDQPRGAVTSSGFVDQT